MTSPPTAPPISPPHNADGACLVTLSSRSPASPGTNDVKSDRFNNLAGWTAANNVLEARIPWQALGFADPSQFTTYVMTGQGKQLAVSPGTSTTVGVQVLLLSGYGSRSASAAPVKYSWSSWILPCFCERFKHGAVQVAAMLQYLTADKTVPLNTTAMLPRSWQYCQCPATPPFLFPYKSWYISAATVVIMIFLGYAGIIRPFLERVLPFMTPSSADVPGARGRRTMQFISFTLFVATSTIFVVTWFLLGQPSPFQMLLEFSNLSDVSSTGTFVVYIFLLTWDSLELLFGVFFVRWKDPPPPKVRARGAAPANLAVHSS